MDAVKFLKEKERMCREHDCLDCPIGTTTGGCAAGAGCGMEKTAYEVVSIVEKWSAEHPRKTRQSEFLKLFPDAKIVNGHINICPQDADSKLSGLMSCVDSCAKCKDQYWLAEVE